MNIGVSDRTNVERLSRYVPHPCDGFASERFTPYAIYPVHDHGRHRTIIGHRTSPYPTIVLFLLSTPKRSRTGKPDVMPANLIDAISGELSREEPDRTKNPAAVELGRLGGLKGRKAHAAKLSKSRRREIARSENPEGEYPHGNKTATARWKR
jgi:hypothetical protein